LNSILLACATDQNLVESGDSVIAVVANERQLWPIESVEDRDSALMIKFFEGIQF